MPSRLVGSPAQHRLSSSRVKELPTKTAGKPHAHNAVAATPIPGRSRSTAYSGAQAKGSPTTKRDKR